MSDESDPIAPPQESGPQGLEASRPDPFIIEGDVREPPPERAAQIPLPARRGVSPIWLAPTAIVGGLIGYGLVQFLNPPPDVASLGASVQAITDAQGAAAKASDLKALSARVDGLEKSAAAALALANAAKAAGALPPAADLTAVNARLDAMDGALKALDAKPDATQPLQEKLAALESSLAQMKAAPALAGPSAPDLAPVNAKLDALDAALKALGAKPDATQPLQEKLAALEASLAQLKAAPRQDGVALAALTEGLSLRFDAGAPFASELATLKRLGADAQALATLASMAESGAPTPQRIAAAFEAIAPSLAPAPVATPSPTPADQGVTGAMMARLASLVKVRVKDAPAPPDANGPSSTIRAALAKGDLAAAAAAFAPVRDKAGAAGDAWVGLIDQRAHGLAAIAALRAGADDALKAAAP